MSEALRSAENAAPTTIGQAVRTLTGAFAKGGIPTPGLDARLLTSHVIGGSAERLILDADRHISAEQSVALDVVRDRRLAREPVSRICGEREFWGLPFRLNDATLDPRPDSETLVSALLTICDLGDRRGERLNILDLGTGTGCLLLSALSELKNAKGVGVDISESAVTLARENASRLALANRCEFIRSNWTDEIAGVFDFVISNPPYIKSDEIDNLEPEVSRHDPRIALDGGVSGVAVYEILAPLIAGRLMQGGWALLEVGENQHQIVAELLESQGFSEISTFPDLSSVTRVVAGKRQNLDRART